MPLFTREEIEACMTDEMPPEEKIVRRVECQMEDGSVLEAVLDDEGVVTISKRSGVRTCC